MATASDKHLAYLLEQVHAGRMKSSQQLLEYLKMRFEIMEFPLEKISKSFLEMQKYNASFDITLDIQPLVFHAYKIKRTGDSHDYFSGRLTDYGPLEFPVESPEEGELLLYLFEEKTNYFWVNNSLLHCELMIERGLDPQSLTNKNLFYLEYESSRQMKSAYQKRLEK
ncbi:hypothetical protein [Enterococcus sp. HY326]|uniref:hypothetical protein n=1 Tax=Enterococcus sp. HY326 TaxID=2971265 RepID=UPI0022408513|nr:hypothetical protein [Enterococcus sp. HY326]